jgi:predicted RNase H-like nuclease (RuvC/YqgF family)
MPEEKSLQELLSDVKHLRRIGKELVRASEKLMEKCEQIRRRVADESAEKLRGGKQPRENPSKK